MMLNVLWTYREVPGAKTGLNSLESDSYNIHTTLSVISNLKIPILIF